KLGVSVGKEGKVRMLVKLGSNVVVNVYGVDVPLPSHQLQEIRVVEGCPAATGSDLDENGRSHKRNNHLIACKVAGILETEHVPVSLAFFPLRNVVGARRRLGNLLGHACGIDAEELCRERMKHDLRPGRNVREALTRVEGHERQD